MDKPVCEGDMLDRFVEEDSLRSSMVEDVPDASADRLRLTATRNDPDFPLHFKLQGPLDVRRVQPFELPSSDGAPMTYTWVYTWYPGVLQAVHTQQEVAEWVESILNESEGWGRAGVRFVRVENRAEARVIFRYVSPENAPNRMGGMTPGAGPEGQDVIEIASNRFGNGFFAVIHHEVAHAAFSAVDMYKGAGHEPYMGIMSGESPTRKPTENDIKCVREWLTGRGVFTHD
jgi:hypothetical protein